MKNKLFKNFKINLFLFFIFFAIFVSFDFFKNIHNIIKYDKDKRIIRNSHFCEKDSQGFVTYLKNKYKFVSNPKLINNTISPISDWVYFDFKKKNNNVDEIILLNYDEFQILDTYLKDGNFVLNETPPLIKTIEGINFYFNEKLDRDQKVSINIYKIENYKRNKIFSKIENFKKNLARQYIRLSVDVSNGSKLRRYSIEIIPFENIDIIKNLNLKVKNNINLDLYEIIDKKKNCYYLRSYD